MEIENEKQNDKSFYCKDCVYGATIFSVDVCMYISKLLIMYCIRLQCKDV